MCILPENIVCFIYINCTFLCSRNLSVSLQITICVLNTYQIPRFRVPPSIQSRKTRINWCWQQANWTVSNWGNWWVTISLQTDDKRIKVWKEDGTRNRLQDVTKVFQEGNIMAWTGISFGYYTGFFDGHPVLRWIPRPHWEQQFVLLFFNRW